MRTCYNCCSDKTYMIKNKWPYWRENNGNWYCKKCYSKMFDNPKYHPITAPKRITFKNKRIGLKEDPRYGICQWCGAVKGIDCKITAMHHEKYDEDNPQEYTVELCVACHMKTKRGMKYNTNIH